MNKKLFKTVATLVSASLVMFSVATCFAADITTSSTSTFDFSTGNVTVTTTANGVGTGKMITYLLSDNATVSSGSNILFIDQKTTTTDDVTFTCTVDITKLESAAAVMKMGSNAGHAFTTDAEELATVIGEAVDANVSLVKALSDATSMTVIAKVNASSDNIKYGATFTAPGKEAIKIYALNATGDDDAVGRAELSDGKYYAISVTGVDSFDGCTLVPFVEIIAAE